MEHMKDAGVMRQALEAINNAAVAYIEGGPYENDLPGLELAMEIDRLSQDFVRPPEMARAYEILNKAPTLTPSLDWVSVEERLPEDEARHYIEDELDGIGYLYPCLLTYKSPITERIHVVRFYYDITQKWFVNNGEVLCEKGRCIAWMPLPAPFDRRPPEGEGNA